MGKVVKVEFEVLGGHQTNATRCSEVGQKTPLPTPMTGRAMKSGEYAVEQGVIIWPRTDRSLMQTKTTEIKSRLPPPPGSAPPSPPPSRGGRGQGGGGGCRPPSSRQS